jgi:hypothetical protein
MAKQNKTVPIVFPVWGPSRAYRAMEPLHCVGYGCGRTIEAGELYTKHKPRVASYYYSLHPFCRVCVPFIERKRSDEELRREFEQTVYRVADDEKWQENYGDRPQFGASVHFW